MGATECTQMGESKISSISFDYITVMEVWARKRYTRGHAAEYQTITPSHCVANVNYYTGMGVDGYACAQDSQISQASNTRIGHRNYALTPDQKSLGIEYQNPWAEFFGFRDASALSNNKAVQEYLCSLSPQSTIMSVLFRHGLVGVATYFTTDIDTQADELIDKLIGTFRNPKFSRPECTAQKMQTGIDAFALVSGIVVGMATVSATPVVQRAIAGAGVLGGGVAAFVMYNGVECEVAVS